MPKKSYIGENAEVLYFQNEWSQGCFKYIINYRTELPNSSPSSSISQSSCSKPSTNKAILMDHILWQECNQQIRDKLIALQDLYGNF